LAFTNEHTNNNFINAVRLLHFELFVSSVCVFYSL